MYLSQISQCLSDMDNPRSEIHTFYAIKLWNTWYLKTFAFLRWKDIYRLECKGLIPRVRRNSAGRLEWTHEEMKIMLTRILGLRNEGRI